MYLHRIVLLCLGFSFSFASICAQEKYSADVRLYTTEQGLPSNHVYQCFQDRRGLMWMLTGAGLCRFDGQQFKLILSKGFNLVFSKNRILFEEPNGDLWIRNHVKKDSFAYQIFNTISGRVIPLRQKLGASVPSKLMNVEYAGQQSYWMTTFRGEVFKVTPGKTPDRVAYFPGLAPVICTADTLNQNLILDLTNNSTRILKCCLLNEKGKELGRYTIPHLQYVQADRKGGYFFYSLDNIGTISPSGKLKQEPIQHYLKQYEARHTNDGVIPLAYDQELQNHWLIHDDQLQVFDQKNGRLNISSSNKLLPSSAFSIFIDRQSIAWVCTIEGLFTINLKPQRFQRLLWLDPRKAKNPVLMSCRGILKDEQSGWLFVSASNCLWLIKDGAMQQIFSKEVGLFGVSQLADHSLLLGSGHLYHYFPDQNITRYIGKIPRDFSIAWSFLPETKRVWIGMNNGLAYLDSNATRFNFVSPELSHPALETAIIHRILPAGEQQLWLLTEKGLFLFHPQKGILARYWTGGKGKYKLPVENLRTCYQEKKDRWWLATSEGLLRWNPLNGESRLFTTNDGLSNNNIYAVYPDQYGFLWMSSDQGIMQFQKRTGKVRVFLPQDGITHREFNRISHFQDRDGRIYFGSLNGVTVFDPRDFYQDFDLNPNISIILTRAQLFSHSSNTLEDAEPNYLLKGKINFKPWHLYLTLRFGLLDYTSPKSIAYEYRIEGLSNHWAACPGGILQLAGLPYGNFQIRVRAKTDNGQYSQQELLLPIHVQRPFYAQLWFMALVLLLISAGIAAFFRYRNQWLKRRKAELEKEVALQTEKIRQDKAIIEEQATELIKLDAAKSRFFANVTHELRTPLTLILGPIETFLQRKKQGQEEEGLLHLAKEHTERLQQMVDDLLDLGKLEAGKLKVEPHPVLLKQKITFLLSAFESHALSKNIELKLEAQINEGLVIELDTRMFQMIFNNLVSNALKFTPAGGQVMVRVSDEAAMFQVEVKDNGRGIHHNDLPFIFDRYFQTRHQETAYEGGTGIGLALARESSRAMGGTLTVSSIWGEGSTFILRLPKKEASTTELKNELATQPRQPYSIQNLAVKPEVTKANILLVEDNASMRQYLTHILSQEYHVAAVGNGQEAQVYLQENLPDLIISDIMMPLMDGFQLLEWLKAGEWAQIPVVMLTARVDYGDKLRALQIGVDDYLLKPFVKAELLIRIQNLLKRQEVRQSFEDKNGIAPAEQNTMNTLEPHQETWLTSIEQAVLEQLDNPDFSVNDLAKAVLMSRSVFYAEMGRMLGLTPNEYINEVRLLKAMEYFQSNPGVYSVKEMASRVGFRDEKYFSRQFKQRFGVLPSQLR